jgi:hypothetical protein
MTLLIPRTLPKPSNPTRRLKADHATEPHSAAAWQQLLSESGAERASNSSDQASAIEDSPQAPTV